MRILIVFVLFFLVVLGLNMPFYPKVKFIEIKQNSLMRTVFHGVLKANNSTILSFQSEGRIVFFPYTKGDYIKKNQVIARLDGVLYSIKKNEEIAKLNEYVIQKQKQDKYYRRLDVLHKEGAISDNDWENAFYESKTINQQIKIQKEKINYLEKEISYNVVLAPYNGYISDKFADVGMYSKIGSPVVGFIASEGLQAEFMADENSINKFYKNQELKVIVNNKEYQGVVSHISKSSLNSGGYLIKVQLLNFDKTLNEGASVDIVLDLEKNKIFIPISCVFKKENQNYVYKIVNLKNGFGRIIEQKIKTGVLLDDKIEILEGLKIGDFVAFGNFDKYYINQKVKL